MQISSSALPPVSPGLDHSVRYLGSRFDEDKISIKFFACCASEKRCFPQSNEERYHLFRFKPCQSPLH